MKPTSLINNFLHENFLLQSNLAAKLYHEVAATLPIVDFHNHLVVNDIAADRQFENLSQLWINGDPYKHRLMRMFGIPEVEITGDAPDEKKFHNWARILPLTLGNPLYHWSAMELQRVFGVDELLNENNASTIWEECNLKLQQESYSATGLLRLFNPEILVTSDKLNEDIRLHQKAGSRLQNCSFLPSLRADDLLQVESDSFIPFLHSLDNQEIRSLSDYQQLIITYLDHFQAQGCKLSDHALNAGFTYIGTSYEKASGHWQKLMAHKPLPAHEIIELKSYLLHFLGCEYAARNWIMQLHIGAHRNTSHRLAELAGGNGGFAGIGNNCDVSSLVSLLNELEKTDLLPRVILYTLNPNDYESLAVLTGSFTQDGLAGKIQLGPAWWYNDHLTGIERHLDVVANYSLLSQFIGMTTDSRSILSLSRHEYFRRIFCNYLAEMVEKKQAPDDWDLLAQMVNQVCYGNSRSIFKQEK